VFWKWQIAVLFTGPRGEVSSNDAYWESWLYYENDTKGTRKERVEQLKEFNPGDVPFTAMAFLGKLTIMILY
jgi:hypothetical protein